jgi:hypothetical protein
MVRATVDTKGFALPAKMQLFLTLLMSFYLLLTMKEVAHDPDSPGRDLAASIPTTHDAGEFWAHTTRTCELFSRGPIDRHGIHTNRELVPDS